VDVPCLSLEGVSRSLGRYHAVEHAGFQIHPREIVALVGHESSGVSEVVRMILGLLRPASGSVSVFGCDVYAGDPAALRRVGSALTPPAFFETWTGRQNLEYAADMACSRDAQRVNWAVARAGLGGRIDDYVQSYSPSFRKRLALARALVAGPQLLVLEEPFELLEPETIRQVASLVRKLAREADVATLIVTQALQEVTPYVNRVIVMDGGRVLHDGPTSQIEAVGREVVVAVDRAEKACEDLVRIRGQSAELISEQMLRIGGHVDVAEVVAFLSGRRYKVTGVDRHEMTLDDVVTRLAAGPLPPPPSVAPNPEDVKDPLELIDDGDSDLSAFLNPSSGGRDEPGPDCAADEGGAP
jgi:ABC-2 type transport system ATP-binding protein